MSVLLLVRHGQASWGAEDYDQLSEAGTAQAALLGSALAARGIHPDRVVSGSMRRHQQTAAACLEAAGWTRDCELDAGWDEFDHVQMLEVHEPPDTEGAALSRREFDRWFDAATQRWISGDHDGDYDEPFTMFTDRVEAALRRTVAGLGSGETAVVFTSGGPISWVAASMLRGGADLWGRLNPVTVNASVTKVVVGGRGTTLVSFNEHSHLEPASITYR